MKVGDLVKITYDTEYERIRYAADEKKIAMIIEGPNEVGKIKILLSSGEVEYMPKDKRYLHD